MKFSERILDLTAYILIPFYTIRFAGRGNWFTTNFSVLGNGTDLKDPFVLWGLMVGIYYFQILRLIIQKLSPQPKYTVLIPLSLLLLVFAITTPYLPEKLPVKAFLHVIFAFFAAVCLAACLLLLIWQLYREAPQEYFSYLVGISFILLFSAFLLLLAGIVSSALEIFFTLSTAWLCRRLYKKQAA